MKKIIFISAIFFTAISLSFSQKALSAAPGEKVTTFGWADLGKMSYAKAKKITMIDDATYPDPKEKREAFTKAIGGGGQRFIVLSGEVDLSDGVITDEDHSYFDAFSKSSGQRVHDDIIFNVSSSTTLIGINGAKVKFGGLRLKGVSNVIIQNVEFWDAHGSTEYDTSEVKHMESKASIDNLVISDGSKNIWIDHCTFSDGVCNDMKRNYNHDGLLDIPFGMNVTISYCEFKNHDKVMLVGSGEKALVPKERSVTLHHNYFHGTTQRMPRTRGTFMHIYNNFYDNIGVEGNVGYSLGPGTNAQFIVENNFFGSHMGVILDLYDKSTGKKPTAFVYFSGNSEELSPRNTQTRNEKAVRKYTDHIVSEKPWQIPYEYESNLQDFSAVKEDVLLNAGAGKEMNIKN